MVRTNSIEIALGTELQFFEMVNVNSSNMRNHNLSFLDERHLLLMFICAHCPFVKYLENEISKLEKEISNHVQIIAISSNDVLNYPDDSPENLKNQA